MAGWGEALKGLRERSGKTKGELGAAVGVTARTVARWEAETRTPGLADGASLARALGVSIAVLVGEAPVPAVPAVDPGEATVSPPATAAAPPPTPPPALPSQATQEADLPAWVDEWRDVVDALPGGFLRTLRARARQAGLHPADLLVQAVGG
jgi:transcriptional regulator with XRE-family HTH domain